MASLLCISKYSKVINITGACLLIILAINKWVSLIFTRMEFILCFYYIILAFVIIVAEFPFKCFQCMLQYFGYMTYNFGKAGNSFFIFGLTVGLPVLNIIVCAFFGLVGIIYLILGCSCRKTENQNSSPDSSRPLSDKPVKIDLNAEASKKAEKDIVNKV